VQCHGGDLPPSVEFFKRTTIPFLFGWSVGWVSVGGGGLFTINQYNESALLYGVSARETFKKKGTLLPQQPQGLTNNNTTLK